MKPTKPAAEAGTPKFITWLKCVHQMFLLFLFKISLLRVSCYSVGIRFIRRFVPSYSSVFPQGFISYGSEDKWRIY
jgi:hypothetical protein